MSTARLNPPADLADLMRFSSRIGQDPLLIQSAGGNTSVKDGDVMWIKASGTLLANALTRNIFVPVDARDMRAAVADREARADQPAQFLLGAGGLRPSIETSLHVVFPQRVVVHVHCVNTLALAIRTDAPTLLADRLAGFDWVYVSYAKPGAQLADSVRRAMTPTTNVVVLGNHGLIVAAETVAEADKLLAAVVETVTCSPDHAARPDMKRLAQRAGDGFVPLDPDHPLHSVAMSPARVTAATGGSLYPDHVIFCGPAAVALSQGETVAHAVDRRLAAGLPPPVFLLVPGEGALIAHGVSAGAQALIRCLGDVLMRLPEGTDVTHLSRPQDLELLDWDAEKYRQSLNAG